MTMTIDEIVREFQELMTAPAGDSPVKRALIKAAASLGDKFTLAELVEAMLGREMTDEELDRLYLLTAEAEGPNIETERSKRPQARGAVFFAYG